MKKIIALVLALVMVACLFTGCGKDKNVTLDVVVAEYGQNTAAWWMPISHPVFRRGALCGRPCDTAFWPAANASAPF